MTKKKTAAVKKPHNHFVHLKPNDVVNFWYGARKQGKGVVNQDGNVKYTMTVKDANAFLNGAVKAEKNGELEEYLEQVDQQLNPGSTDETTEEGSENS